MPERMIQSVLKGPQFHRGTTAANAAFAGLKAEITVDTDSNTLVVHDGSRVGGYPINEGEYNVKGFGAIGDGVTDDYASIQRAITSAETAGTHAQIYLPPGTYRVSQTLVFSNKGVGMYGSGYLSSIYLTGINQAAIYINGAVPTNFSDQTVFSDFNVSASSKTGTLGIYIYSTVSQTLRNISTTNCHIGLSLLASQFDTFTNVVCNQNDVGMWLRSALADGGGNNNNFTDCKFYANTVGMIVWQAANSFPMGENCFTNCILNGNSVCAAYLQNQETTTFVNTSPEANQGGASSYVFPEGGPSGSLTISNSIWSLDGTSLALKNYQHVSNSANAFILTNSSNVWIDGMSSAYLNTSVDKTSFFGFAGKSNLSNYVSRALTLGAMKPDNQVTITSTANNISSAVRNDVLGETIAPVPSAVSGGITSGTEVVGGLGTIGYVQFDAVTGNAGYGATFPFMADTSVLNTNLFFAMMVRADRDCSLSFDFYQSSANTGARQLYANEWTLITMMTYNQVAVRGGYFVAYTNDTTSPKVNFTRFFGQFDISKRDCAALALWQPFSDNAQSVFTNATYPGNASVTLAILTSPKTVIYNTPITADRTVTLPSAAYVRGNITGTRYRVVRTANCTGAFNVIVGGLKNLAAASTWADVEYVLGVGWVLIGYGTL